MEAEDLLFILYTSGTTAAPKGIMHTTGGYLTQVAYTHRVVFDLHPDEDVYWAAADIGWVTGHSYIVYGPLANGATSVMYEGTPDTPGRDRWWSIVERYGVTILYCAPTAIRTFMKWGADEPAAHDLSSLRLLGSVGEPINPEAWMWYAEHIGGGPCPVVDTWWQTETGAIMIAPLPGITTTKPGSATFPLPGHRRRGRRRGGARHRARRRLPDPHDPWPAMLRGIYGDPERYRDTYWSRFDGRYFAGDGAKIDDDGYLWLLGRVDDVMNVSGHRISTTEVESALVDHYLVAESAVVGAVDQTTGQAIVAFVTLVADAGEADDERGQELRAHVATRSDRSPGRRRSSSPTSSPRPGAARSCVACCATWPRAACWGTPRRWPTPRWWRRSGACRRPRRARSSGVGDPGNWAWRDGRIEAPGQAVVFDMDGVLSDAVGRQHFIEQGRRNWDAFFDACGEDAVIDELARVLELLDPKLQIVLLTGRPIRVQPQTLAWLDRYDLRWDLLVMRARGDYSQVTWYKRDLRRGAPPLRVRPSPGLRGRPEQLRHVPRHGHPLRVHPLRLLRVARSVRLAGSTPVHAAPAPPDGQPPADEQGQGRRDQYGRVAPVHVDRPGRRAGPRVAGHDLAVAEHRALEQHAPMGDPRRVPGGRGLEQVPALLHGLDLTGGDLLGGYLGGPRRRPVRGDDQ